MEVTLLYPILALISWGYSYKKTSLKAGLPAAHWHTDHGSAAILDLRNTEFRAYNSGDAKIKKFLLLILLQTKWL